MTVDADDSGNDGSASQESTEEGEEAYYLSTVRGRPPIRHKAALTRSINYEKKSDTRKSLPSIVHTICLMVLLGGVYLNYCNLWPASSCQKTFQDLKYHFKGQQKDLWYSVESFLNKEEKKLPVYTLIILHSLEASATASCLATHIAETFACERNNSAEITTITPTEVNVPGDFGELLQKYRYSPGAVVVKNATEIMGNKAQIFHTMCDDITAYKHPSLYIFTIPIEKYSSEKPQQLARAMLESAWGELSESILSPLLSRILGFVFTIKPEPTLPC